jgi:hypothetical protein
VRQGQLHDLVDVALIQAVWVVGSAPQPRVTAQQDERLHPLGMRRGEYQCGSAARQVAGEHSLLAACLVQDRANVIDLVVHGRHGAAGDRV